MPDTEQQVQLKGALAGSQVPTCLGLDASGGTYPHLCALVGSIMTTATSQDYHQ